jgi:ribosomal protein S18 acetylase RimI-like enzyme
MKSDVQIRFALPDESEAIAGVISEAFAPFKNLYTAGAFAATVISPEKIRQRFNDAGAVWAVLKNGKIVGTVSVLPDGEWLYIRSMAVLPAAQGLGIGRRLLEAVENYAVRNGFEKLFLYTTPYLPAAIKLYEQNGFVRGELEPERFFGTPCFEMQKKLD